MLLSIIVPCYNEESVLPLFYEAIRPVADQLWAERCWESEIIFVDDGSRDRTVELLRDFARRDERMKFLSFSRNFGKEAAMLAGLDYCRGDYVVIMDADLQHPPALLPKMAEIMCSGDYDCVATKRSNRSGEPPIRSWFARLFYRIINKLSDAEVVDGACDFRLMKRGVVDSIIRMREVNRFSKGIFGWVGYRIYWLPFENVERAAGETKWSFWKLFRYAIDGIINFSTAPLVISSVMGALFCLLAFLWMFIIVVRTLIWGDPVAGWPTLACILLFIGGTLHISLGIIGQYLGKAYMESKHRPHYIVRETAESHCRDFACAAEHSGNNV